MQALFVACAYSAAGPRVGDNPYTRAVFFGVLLPRSPRTTVTQRDLSLTGGIRMSNAKWIANCEPIDRLAISHVLSVKCTGTSIERSRDDE